MRSLSGMAGQLSHATVYPPAGVLWDSPYEETRVHRASCRLGNVAIGPCARTAAQHASHRVPSGPSAIVVLGKSGHGASWIRCFVTQLPVRMPTPFNQMERHRDRKQVETEAHSRGRRSWQISQASVSRESPRLRSSASERPRRSSCMAAAACSRRKLSIPPPCVDQAIIRPARSRIRSGDGVARPTTSVHKLPWLAPCVFGWIGRGRARNRCCCFQRALTNASPTMDRVGDFGCFLRNR
jgi:hypothetical protein